MFQNVVRSCLLLFILTATLQGQGPRTLPETLVQTVNSLPGWTALGNPETFNESNIVKFDPKPASDLRTLGLNNVTVQTWQSPSGRVRAALFQFIDFGAAYSFFTNQRRILGGVSTAFSAGAESFQDRNFSYFWQANYMVRLNGESRSIENLARSFPEIFLVDRKDRQSRIVCHLQI
jgi:hypothetical protein